MFQFPLHRDPRCNPKGNKKRVDTICVSVPFTSGSSLQQSLPWRRPWRNSVSVPFTSGSSLQQRCGAPATIVHHSFSSLYIGILAATTAKTSMSILPTVSVPFTSGSSLQPGFCAALYPDVLFQFPLHRDPRCNIFDCDIALPDALVSVPFTSGSSLQPACFCLPLPILSFQFPLHRDPRCNRNAKLAKVACQCFSSLYIGILAATEVHDTPGAVVTVSVPFTSGSSLQQN